MVRGTAVEEIPRPPIQEGRHRSLTAEGGGGGDSASSGGRVASPASTVSRRFNLSWSLFSSNICGFFPSVSPGGGLLTSGHKAPPRAAVQ